MSTALTTFAVALSVSPAKADESAESAPDEIVVVGNRTRSELTLKASELQQIVPGVNAVRAIEVLPGVIFENADPWGNNEQNSALYIHGFAAQQLGYTLDGVPLGDQSYGNYNGLSPQRAITSENIDQVSLSSGAGDLGTASTSNLGGTLAVFSSDPASEMGGTIAQTFGSYDAFRTYARFDTGKFAGDNSAYVSFEHLDARAWDFNGQQGGNQVNAKFMNVDDDGTFKAYFDWSDKIEPNEDAVSYGNGQKYLPYTRAFLYPNLAYALTYVSPTGATPAFQGANFSNYFSDAQRTDYLGYLSYDYDFGNGLTWKNQAYYHHDDGRGVVALPISGAASVFNVYYPGQNLKQVLGNSGYGVRTTEYLIDREGFISNLDYELGDHRIEFGVWYEHNATTTSRRWYQLNVNDPLTPYDQPVNPLFTQVQSQISNNVVQTHLQDAWHVLQDVTVQAGFKSSLQFANGRMPVQPLPGSYSGAKGNLPQGEIDTLEGFLPELGLIWDIDPNDHIFVNVQKNLRQYITYGLGGASPWSLASQGAFDLFKQSGHPETSWTYEAGWRYNHDLDAGPLSGIGGQISYYHVDFSNRQLLISPNPTLTTFVGGAAILENVGGVTTDGVDMSTTLHFGPHFSLYDALSYNRSTYDVNYTSGTSVVPTAGKLIPGDPEWMNKFVASAGFGSFDAKLIGEFIGRRYATYTNDLSVPSYELYSLEMDYNFGDELIAYVKNLKLMLNVTNLTDTRGASTITIGAASGTYAIYPIAPRQYFLTLEASF